MRKSLEVKSNAEDVSTTSGKILIPEAHPVEETKRSGTQEDDNGPLDVGR